MNNIVQNCFITFKSTRDVIRLPCELNVEHYEAKYYYINYIYIYNDALRSLSILWIERDIIIRMQ